MTKNEPKSEDIINDSLKRLYQDALDEELPNRFLDLIGRLKAQDAETAPKKRRDET